jgi:hypothetical protein
MRFTGMVGLGRVVVVVRIRLGRWRGIDVYWVWMRMGRRGETVEGVVRP